MSEHATVLTSRVRLARNYVDLPFDAAGKPDCAAMCVSRTANALRLSGDDRGFMLMQLRDVDDVQRRALAECRLISRDLLRCPDTAAVLLNEEAGVSVMMNEEDHLRIQAVQPGMELQRAADACFRVEDALSRQVSFAFDAQLGYLTACPTNTGTGMRASLLMHLPMLTLCKQMGSVGQIVAKVGLTIRGVYGEGAEALGNLYLVSNQVTLGRTEQELINAVNTVGCQLTDMEVALREKAMATGRLPLEDTVFRGWGTLRYARCMSLNEFYRHWSGLRLGAALGLVEAPLPLVDELLVAAQEGNLQALNECADAGRRLDELRAAMLRDRLSHIVT